MNLIKRFRDIASSLRGSAFRHADYDAAAHRRAGFEQHSVMFRAIATYGGRHRELHSIPEGAGRVSGRSVDIRARVEQERNLHLSD